MKSIKPATVASCLAAILIGVAQAEATLAEMPDRLTKSVDHQGHVPRTIAESGKFHCSLTTLNYLALLFLGTLLGLSLCLCQLLPEIVDYSNGPVPDTVEICRCR